MKAFRLWASFAVVLHVVITSVAQNQISKTCMIDVALLDLQGPNFGVDELCVAGGNKVTIVIRCSSGTRYASQASLNPCLEHEPLVSLQYDSKGTQDSNVTVLVWLHTGYDLVDSVMYSFQPSPDLFTSHEVVGDLRKTRFVFAIAQRCVLDVLQQRMKKEPTSAHPSQNDFNESNGSRKIHAQTPETPIQRHRREEDATEARTLAYLSNTSTEGVLPTEPTGHQPGLTAADEPAYSDGKITPNPLGSNFLDGKDHSADVAYTHQDVAGGVDSTTPWTSGDAYNDDLDTTFSGEGSEHLDIDTEDSDKNDKVTDSSRLPNAVSPASRSSIAEVVTTVRTTTTTDSVRKTSTAALNHTTNFDFAGNSEENTGVPETRQLFTELDGTAVDNVEDDVTEDPLNTSSASSLLQVSLATETATARTTQNTSNIVPTSDSTDPVQTNSEQSDLTGSNSTATTQTSFTSASIFVASPTPSVNSSVGDEKTTVSGNDNDNNSVPRTLNDENSKETTQRSVNDDTEKTTPSQPSISASPTTENLITAVSDIGMDTDTTPKVISSTNTTVTSANTNTTPTLKVISSTNTTVTSANTNTTPTLKVISSTNTTVTSANTNTTPTPLPSAVTGTAKTTPPLPSTTQSATPLPPTTHSTSLPPTTHSTTPQSMMNSITAPKTTESSSTISSTHKVITTASLATQAPRESSETLTTAETPDEQTTTLTIGASGSSSGLALTTDTSDEENDTFWPIVAALVIGIPTIIVFGIAITVIYRRRLATPARLRSASMHPPLKTDLHRGLRIGGLQQQHSVEV